MIDRNIWIGSCRLVPCDVQNGEGIDIALVFEDDAVLSPDFAARWRELSVQLRSDDGWDIAFLG